MFLIDAKISRPIMRDKINYVKQLKKGEYTMKAVLKWFGKTILSLGILCVILYVFMTYVIGLIL